MRIILKNTTAFFLLIASTQSFAHSEMDEHSFEEYSSEAFDEYSAEQTESYFLPNVLRGCTKATASQISIVNQGNNLQNQFLDACESTTGNNTLCQQVRRPNPSSKSTFYCTYSANQPHQLIHPSMNTWKFAFKAIELIDRLKAKGICVSHIYNWWRPEPYNKNVGGAAGRHPNATSVDVRFCTKTDAVNAFDMLCVYRKMGEVRALGYYGSTGVHVGVGDSVANTWGRSCKE